MDARSRSFSTFAFRCLAAVLVASAVIPTGLGCDELSTPAQLDHPQILAVRADPPSLAPGAVAELSVLVAGPQGDIEPARIEWSAQPGSVEIAADGTALYTAPPASAEPRATVQLMAHLPDGSVLSAIKAIALGAEPAARPAITGLSLAGERMEEDALAILAPGEVAAVSIEVEPAPGENAQVSWFATIGDLARYRQNPAELSAPGDRGQGWLYAVYRDGQGWITWQRVPVAIE